MKQGFNLDKKQINIFDLINPIIDSIQYPIALFTFDLNFITGNKQFNNQFGSGNNLIASRVFDQLTIEELKKKFLLLRENDIVEPLIAVPAFFNDREYIVNIRINRIHYEDEEYFALIFETKDIGEKYKSDLSFLITDSIKEYISDEIIELFYEISRFLPFTLIERNRIKKILDLKREPLWFCDSEGYIIISNKSFERIAGITLQDSGKIKLDSFFYPYQLSIINSSISYTRLTRKAIVLKGLVLSAELRSKNVLVLIPITDKEGKYYYSAGIIVETKDKTGFNNEILKDYYDQNPLPFLVISRDGLIQHANQEFIKLTGENSVDFNNLSFEQIFPEIFSEKLKTFWESDLNEFTIELSGLFSQDSKYSENYKIRVKKIYNDINEVKKLALVFYPIEKVNDLENLIKHRGRMFDILIQKNPEPIFIYDRENLRFLEVNEAALELYGYSREEFLQLDLTDLYSPDDIQTLLDSFNETELDKKFSRPFRHKKKDGSTIFVEISRFEFKFNDQDAHFTIVREVTDKIELNKKLQIFESIFDETSDPVLRTDPFGFIKSFNKATLEKLGYLENELMDSSFISLTSDDERGIVNTSIFQPPVREEVKLNLTLKNKEGNLIQAEITATPVLDITNEVESFTIIIKLPEARESFEKPKEIVKEVIREVIVEKPIKAGRKTEIPESAFLSGVFHELLTPLNVIFGFSQEIIESLENPTPEQQEAAEIINQNRVKLLDTMNSVVEYSEIIQNRSPIKISQVSVTDIIDKLDKQIQDLIGANDIQFGYGKISSSLTFETDRDKFERMISGLIKVIARINREKKIYFSAFTIDEKSFMIALSDQYGSISNYLSNTLEKLFALDKDPKDVGAPKLTTHLTKFFIQLLGGKFVKQLNYAGRTECGFVFPLKLTEEQIVEQQELFPTEQTLGGEELKESSAEEEEEIKTFSDQAVSQTEKEQEEFEPVTPVSEILTSKLPEEQKADLQKIEQQDELNEISKELDKDLQEIAESVQASEEEVAPEKVVVPPTIDLSKLNCLYIEDQVDSQILFKVQLKGLKDIQFAPSFEDALPLLDKYTFDFIVIDINLQGEYNGLDALKLIHKMPGYENTPIIAVTAYVLPGDKEKFIAAGFDDFIAKPIFREKMIDSLQKIFLSKS